MELSDKKIMYNVKNQDSNLKLEGEIQILESGIVVSFYGTLYTLVNEYSGSFTLNEHEDGTIDASINGYTITQGDKGYNLIKSTVEAVKATLVE